MGPTRTTRPANDDLHLLLVGTDSWRAEVRPKFATSDTFSTTCVETAQRVLSVVTEPPVEVDCIVSGRRLEGTDGLELLADLRSRGVSTPFVLAPTDGSEALASEAIEAGVTDYLSANADPTDFQRRCRRAVRKHREAHRRDVKADGFEAVFSAPGQFTAVLAADGTVARINSGALEHLDVEETAVLGKRFWGLPWSESDDSRRQVQRAIRCARQGESVDFEAGFSNATSAARLEFTVHPVSDDAGDVRHLVVEGREAAERARLEAELRESEELHRVTLNNMTDTVLVTNDDGEFTYVCPNVHFIFGYSAEEIHELGTIDALLGEDLFDRDRLEAEDVLTNVECSAKDKDGQEHTLLVNVRNVSIQGGTTLYSCRDITKRKQRERALTQLHQISRTLLYTETKPEIANRVVSDATSVLESAAGVIYQFDREENVLYPTAVSDELDAMVGRLPELRLDRDTVVGRAFIEDETRTCRRADSPESQQLLFSTLSDYVAVPLGDHGVFVAAAPDGESFDEVGEEVAELLAATTEAAFDRVERESELRERDRTLQRQNRRLSQLNRINGFIREIDQALVGAESREKIETAVCERLTDDDRFAFAWIGETTPLNRTLRPRTWAGNEQGYLDSVQLEFDQNAEVVEPSIEAADEREARLVSNVADLLRSGQWCKEAVSREFQSVLSIPLTYDDVLFGTLSVYAGQPDAFDEMVKPVLCELGDTVAAAINAVQRKEALQSDTVVELEYRISDPSAVPYKLANESGASLKIEGDVVRDDGTTLVFATVEDGDLDRVVETADEFVGITNVESIRETDEGGVVGFRIRGNFVTTVLADHGAVLRRLRATPDGLSLAVDVPDSVTTRSIDEVISNVYDAAEPVAQRERTRALDTTGSPGRFTGSQSGHVFDNLTERQLEVAQIAYHTGFFDSHRDVTGRDVASMLDISHTAFYDHVRRIQRKLFASLFENSPGPGKVE